jgi:hypothetical protein
MNYSGALSKPIRQHPASARAIAGWSGDKTIVNSGARFAAFAFTLH